MKHSRHFVVLAVAGLMLALSFAGGATAGLLITGKQIKDNSISSRDLKNGTVKSRDIKNRGVTTRDVKDRTLKLRDFRKGTKNRLRGEDGADGLPGLDGADGAIGPIGPEGPRGLPGLPGVDGDDGLPGLDGEDGAIGPIGPEGPEGPIGPQGLPGVSGFEVVTSSQDIAATLTDTVSASCPAGKTALAASGGFGTLLTALASQVTRVDADTFSVTGLNGSGVTRTLSLDVTCVTLAETS